MSTPRKKPPHSPESKKNSPTAVSVSSAATLDIEDIPIATLRRYRNWAFPATLTDDGGPVRFLIDNLHDWVQPQAIEWYIKSEPQTCSLDKYVLSPTVRELKAFKAFLLPSPVANDPTFCFENWEVWVNPMAFTQFKSTLAQPTEACTSQTESLTETKISKSPSPQPVPPDLHPQEAVQKEQERQRSQSLARSTLKSMMKPKRRSRPSLPASDTTAGDLVDDKDDDKCEVTDNHPPKKMRH